MLKFYGLDFSFYDHPGFYSLILYTSGCNLRCYGCHNRTLAGWDYSDDAEKVMVDVDQYYRKLSREEVKMSVDNDFIDIVVLCGGEVLIYPLEKIISTIDYIKSLNPSVKIRIDTNGTYPEKVKKLIAADKVDGFAIDIKGPYWNEKYSPEVSKVIGMPEETTRKLMELMTESLHYAKVLPYSLFRTVKYPIIQDFEYFEEVKDYVKKYLQKDHYINQFVNL